MRVKYYEVTRQMAAEPAAVWSVISDAGRLVAADTGVARIEGSIAPGSRFTIWSEAVPGRGFRTTVELMDPPHEMVWSGGMPLGLFRGVRRFRLEAREDGGTTFRMREEFSGPMLPLVWRSMPDLQPSFEQFADGVARGSEVPR